MSHDNKSKNIGNTTWGTYLRLCVVFSLVLYELGGISSGYGKLAAANANLGKHPSASAYTGVPAAIAESSDGSSGGQDNSSNGQDGADNQPVPSANGNTPEQSGRADIDALAMAVSFAETDLCTTGTALLYNNCVGIRVNGQFARYDTTDKSLDDFKYRWTKYYGGRFPTRKAAAIWTGNDRPDTWLELVKEEYARRIAAK